MITTGPHPWLRKSFRLGIDARCLDTPRIHSIYSSNASPNSSRTGSSQLSRAGRHATERDREGPASSPGASSTCVAAIQAARTARKGPVFAFSAKSTSSFPRRSRKPLWQSGRRRTHSSNPSDIVRFGKLLERCEPCVQLDDQPVPVQGDRHDCGRVASDRYSTGFSTHSSPPPESAAYAVPSSVATTVRLPFPTRAVTRGFTLPSSWR